MQGRTIVGSQLRELRLQADLSTAQMAALVGVVEGHVRNIEGKGDQPSGRLAYRFVRVLSTRLNRAVTLDDFSSEDDEDEAAA